MTDAPAPPSDPTARTWALVAVVLAVLIGAAVAAFTIAGGRSDDVATGITDLPSPTVSGEALSPFAGNGEPDPSIGRTMPLATGVDVTGAPMELAPTGDVQAIVFLAHWCPHCQREVPAVQSWLDQGGLPEGTSVSAVATAYDSSRDNWPPDLWLVEEGFTPPTLSDGANNVAEAYGLTSFPYWVFVDGDGVVLGRVAGQLETEVLENVLSSFAAG